MQLDKLVAYHKALGDPTRLRMLMLLSEGEASGQELADRLNLSQPTITHHAAKLRQASLLNERREKNTVYFSLNRYFIENHALATQQFIFKKKEIVEEMEDKNESLKESVLRNFFAKDGHLKQIPAQLKKKLIVLEYMVSKLDPGHKYGEREINEFIKPMHEDYATLRRELIMHQFMYRENEEYELNPREMWTDWRALK
ncbi:Transcriptional repressor SdpR [compost metagenome]